MHQVQPQVKFSRFGVQQVQAVGMNLPDTLSPSFAVRPGSYRVTIRHHEVSGMLCKPSLAFMPAPSQHPA